MKKWNTFQIVFLAFCASLNVGVGAIVSLVKLPVYLDSIGTIMAAALGGWVYGSAVGLFSVVVSTVMIAPTSWAYGGTAIIIALCVSVLRRYGYLRSLSVTIGGGLIVGIAAAIISAPVTTYLYGGVSLAGTDAVTAFFKAMGNTLLESVILSGFSTDPFDKLISSVIAFSLMKALPKRLFDRFPNGQRFIAEDKNTNAISR